MKNLRKIMIATIVIFMMSACSIEPLDTENSSIDSENATANQSNQSNEVDDGCVDANPRVRLTNNGQVNYDLDVYIGNTQLGSVHDILPGETTEWIIISEGEILFAVSNDTYMDEKVLYDMTLCMEFDMEIGVDNQLTSAVPGVIE
ncbi:MAG: hypothetical protein HRT67_11255 [Flavobacteriaceae bacterium]|nr:hypothetical protein [Flavobacteriaceae bacterium]